MNKVQVSPTNYEHVQGSPTNYEQVQGSPTTRNKSKVVLLAYS